MNIAAECKSQSRDTKIVLKDKKSKSHVCVTFINKLKKCVEIILVDDCVIKDGKRCDYLLSLEEDEIEYYIELKGSDVSHAVKQLERTITLLSKDTKKQPKHCFVISSRCPLATAEIQNLKIKFKKEYNSSFLVKNSRYEYALS